MTFRFKNKKIHSAQYSNFDNINTVDASPKRNSISL